VAAGDAGVVEDEIGAALLAAEDQLGVDGVLAAGPCTCVDDQCGVVQKPGAGLEPATPSLPWKCSTN
jgi:hypothetical protein